jgi:hypothetical protein
MSPEKRPSGLIALPETREPRPVRTPIESGAVIFVDPLATRRVLKRPESADLDLLMGAYTASEIGQMFHTNDRGVYAWIWNDKRKGYEFEHHTPLPVRVEDQETVRALAKDMSLITLAEQTGYPVSALRRFFADEPDKESPGAKGARLRMEKKAEPSVVFWGSRICPLASDYHDLVSTMYADCSSVKEVYRRLTDQGISHVREIQIAHFLSEKGILLSRVAAVREAMKRRNAGKKEAV